MIKLDDKSIEDFGFYIQPEFEEPITPNLEKKTIDIPGRAGAWDFGYEIGERPLNYPIKILDRFHDRMQSSFNELVAFLFDEYGKPREIKLVREYEPDKYLTVKVAEPITPDRMTEDGELNLPLVAYDPYKYAGTFADEIIWGSEEITFQYSYLLGREGVGGSVEIIHPQTITIPVDGLAIQPIFEIEGTAESLEISSNGYSIKLPNFKNRKIKIDFEHYLVFRDGKETMLELKHFFLLPGENKLKINGKLIDLDMRIKYRDKFN